MCSVSPNFSWSAKAALRHALPIISDRHFSIGPEVRRDELLGVRLPRSQAIQLKLLHRTSYGQVRLFRQIPGTWRDASDHPYRAQYAEHGQEVDRSGRLPPTKDSRVPDPRNANCVSVARRLAKGEI